MSNSAEITLPLEWDDDERMNFMFSDFKENRDVNTTDWDSKMDFWTALIVKSCKDRRTVCVNLQELNKIFKRKEKSPLGLATVIQSMATCGKIQRESEFAANVDCGWLSWGVGLLLVKPLKWTFSALLGSSRVHLEESFVIIELVKEKAAELLRVYRSSEFSSCSIVSFQDLCTLSSNICADEGTLCMALLQLQRDKQVMVSLHEGEKIVKFCLPGQDRVSAVSDVDIGIYQLQRSEKLLGERVEKLGLEADKCKEEARILLREGKKSQALRCLRGRKRVEKRADNLFAKLESIREILDRIAQSQSDKMVMQAYQAGVAALRLSLKDVTVERAESLVDQIQELCDTQDEVNQTISSGVTAADEDMDELEEELKSLLNDSKPDSVSGLPTVPATNLQPSAESILSSLPDIPQRPLNISTEQLEEELNQLTLTDSGFQKKKLTSPAKILDPAQ
ncbi:charged multivesicular body protein 7 [Maylandia zebra]|uniref:Charged multivesicular body protein 7 n=4 Tax=Haplochromini TaxID=319058 RepID=A0A3B4EU32_9CICH|nr:charged multivesicular body protein 7 [Maylandia zebra]XP_005729627.1 PREDICTED: charged multivesicular body protein 7 isoform X1 [Pundamilia nyererei]XP_026043000.1 charged multivesicular body protein 7 [Astatotilapia calliptera]